MAHGESPFWPVVSLDGVSHDVSPLPPVSVDVVVESPPEGQGELASPESVDGLHHVAPPYPPVVVDESVCPLDGVNQPLAHLLQSDVVAIEPPDSGQGVLAVPEFQLSEVEVDVPDCSGPVDVVTVPVVSE